MEPIDSGLHVAGLTEFLAGPAPAGMDLQPGARVGDVTIVRLVDEGGMGRVYEGLQGMPCRTVAVKMIRPGVLSPAAARRFEYEAQILGRLTHPGIARIYSVGMQPLAGSAVPYFVMEYVEEARSITDFATSRGLGIRDRIALFREACRAVAHGHQKGVIHRDLKPGNILVDAAGHPKVIDFGVARSTDADVARATMLTDVGQLVGTLQYMSPEQFDGEVDEIDVRADVYALGVVLYELLAGRPPYEIAKRPVYEAARIVREAEPRSLATVNPKLRGDLATIVAKCLEKERNRRYSSAAELEADLGRYGRGEPITASPPGLLDGLVRLARRHRLAAAAGAVSLTALVAAVIGISIFAVSAERERRDAVASRERANTATRVAKERLYVANLLSLQAALDGRNVRLARRLFADNLALIGSPPPLEMRLLGAGLDDAVAVLDLKRGPVSRVRYGPDGGVLAAAASAFPDLTALEAQEVQPASHRAFFGNAHSLVNSRNERLFFWAADATGGHAAIPAPDTAWMRTWQAETADLMGFEPAARGHGIPLAVTSDGQRLAVHAADGRVRIVARPTGEVEATLEGHRGRLAQAVFTADGSRLILQDQRGRLGLWNADTGARLAVGDVAEGPTDAFILSPDGGRLAVVDRVTAASPAAGTLGVHATADGRTVATIVLPVAAPASTRTTIFSPDGSRLVAATDGDELAVWDAGTGHEVGRLRGHAATVTAIAFSPDGGQVATGAANGVIRLWNTDDFTIDRELVAHDSAVMTLAFRPDAALLASGSHDGTVRIWSRTGRQRLADIGGKEGIDAAAFSPDGRLLAIAPRNTGTVEIWDPRAVERRCVLDAAGAVVTRIVFAPAGGRVAALLESTVDATDLLAWDVAGGELVAAFGPHDRGLAGAAFSPDGAHLLTTSRTGVVRLWDVAAERWLWEFVPRTIPTRQIGAAAEFAEEGTRVVSATPEILDVATGSIVGELKPRGNVTAVAVSPDGRTVASGVASGAVYVSRVTAAVPATTSTKLTGHSRPVLAVAFNADGTRLATASDDGTARLWDVGRMSELQVFGGHEAPVETVSITPDGGRVVTGSRDGSVRVWDASSGVEVCRLRGESDRPRTVALSPDGTLLVTTAPDGAVRIQGLSNADVTRARANPTAAAPTSPVPPTLRGTPPDRRDPAG